MSFKMTSFAAEYNQIVTSWALDSYPNVLNVTSKIASYLPKQVTLFTVKA